MKRTPKELIGFYENIPVYPLFATKYYSMWGINANAPLCEDDRGHVCFISEEAKRNFLEGYKRRMKI